MGIRSDLFGHVFLVTRLDVKLAFEDMYGAERPYTGLVTVHCSQIIRLAVFNEIINFLHTCKILGLILRMIDGGRPGGLLTAGKQDKAKAGQQHGQNGTFHNSDN